MTTFHIIHLLVGIWLAFANFSNIMPPASLATNNIILGVVVALYNAYYLFAQRSVDVEQKT